MVKMNTMKKYIKYIMHVVVAVTMATTLNSCHDADPEFVHTDNLIQQLYMMTTLQGTQYPFTIEEYDAQGNLVTEDITAERVAGGYGMAHITFPITQVNDIDLTQVYITATVGYDVIITPCLSGMKHDITAKDEDGNLVGFVIKVKAGSGKVRQYRVYGYFN